MIAKMLPTSMCLPESEKLYIGIDVSKASHVAAFISPSLLLRHRSYQRCPTFTIANERTDFERLLRLIEQYVPLSRCAVLLERTGHYHLPLQHYLMEQGIDVYEVHVQVKASKVKNDKRDAQHLANTLYNQIHLGVQVREGELQARRVALPSEAAQALRIYMQRRSETIRKTTRIKNQLTSLLDTIFPEFTQVLNDPNGDTALNIRMKFPLPADIAAASIDDLKACRAWRRPGNAGLLKLRELAQTTIGIKAPARLKALAFEQCQLIEELRLLQRQLEEIEAEIATIVEESREGKILLSMEVFGPIAAGAVIATIGTITNFETPGKLKRFAGWAPNQSQTGVSRDVMKLGKGGNRMLKQAMFLTGTRAIHQDTEWRDLYARRVREVCQWDERKQQFVGKSKVLGRIIGQILNMVYVFLKRDYELIASTPPGEILPQPVLYDRDIHKKHRKSKGL